MMNRFIFPFLLFSQEKNEYYFNGNINFNNNGIDWIPLFSRGKPTIISSLSFGKDRFSINSLIRYDLEGLQLWGIDLYWNYQIIRKEKIKFDLGLFLPGVFTTEVNVQEENLPNKEPPNAFLSSSIIKFAVPSAVFNATLPVKPSDTITLTSPFIS